MKFIIDKFDSRIFNLTVAKIVNDRIIKKDSYADITEYIKKNKINILGIFTILDRNFINYLQMVNFNFIGTQCYLELQVHKEDKQCLSNLYYQIKFYRSKDYIPLLSINNIIKKSSRWVKDPKVTEELVNRYYKCWLENSVNGYADKIFIEKHDHKIIGMLTLKKINKIGKIDLFGILPEYQRQGVGTTMINKLKSYSIKNKINKIQVVTELENITALNFYLKNGFKFIKYYLVFHRHFNE